MSTTINPPIVLGISHHNKSDGSESVRSKGIRRSVLLNETLKGYTYTHYPWSSKTDSEGRALIEYIKTLSNEKTVSLEGVPKGTTSYTQSIVIICDANLSRSGSKTVSELVKEIANRPGVIALGLFSAEHKCLEDLYQWVNDPLLPSDIKQKLLYTGDGNPNQAIPNGATEVAANILERHLATKQETPTSDRNQLKSDNTLPTTLISNLSVDEISSSAPDGHSSDVEPIQDSLDKELASLTSPRDPKPSERPKSDRNQTGREHQPSRLLVRSGQSIFDSRQTITEEDNDHKAEESHLEVAENRQGPKGGN